MSTNKSRRGRKTTVSAQGLTIEQTGKGLTIQLVQGGNRGQFAATEQRELPKATAADQARWNTQTTTHQTTVSFGEQGNGLCFTGTNMTVEAAQALKQGINLLFRNTFLKLGAPAQVVTTEQVDELLSPTSRMKPGQIGLTNPTLILSNAMLLGKKHSGFLQITRTIARVVARVVRTNWPAVSLPPTKKLEGIVMTELKKSQLFTPRVFHQLSIDQIGIYTMSAQRERPISRESQATTRPSDVSGSYPWQTTLATSDVNGQTIGNEREFATAGGPASTGWTKRG